jgi:hypothetical protein
MKRAFLKGSIRAGKARLFLVIRTRDDQKTHEQRSKNMPAIKVNAATTMGSLSLNDQTKGNIFRRYEVTF